MEAASDGDPRGRRLNTWKEIASFFACDERTVKRWEAARGLPVHRIPNGARSPVFAYESELQSWLHSGGSADTLAFSGSAATDSSPVRLDRPAAILIAALALGALVFGYFWTMPSAPSPADALQRQAHRPSKEALTFYRAGLFERQTRTPAGLRHALDDFTQAIVRDPQYAEAYAGLAQCYELLREYTTVTPDYAFPRAKAAADRAIALNPSLADAHLALAFAEFYWFHHSAAARREFERAIALAPGNAVAHHWYATFVLEMAEFPRAIAEIDEAAALDTESNAILADKGLILFYAGRRQESISLLKQLEQAQPQFASTHRYLAKVDLAEHDDAGFLRELSLASGAVEDADEQAIVAAGAKGLAISGRSGMLKAMLYAEEPLVRDGRASAYAVAIIHAELGDANAAMDWLRTSLLRSEADITGLAIEPSFRLLRGEPEFRRLARAAGVYS